MQPAFFVNKNLKPFMFSIVEIIESIFGEIECISLNINMTILIGIMRCIRFCLKNFEKGGNKNERKRNRTSGYRTQV